MKHFSSLPKGPIVGEDPGAQAQRRAKQRAESKGYAVSQRIRKRIEEIFGWCKMIGGLGRARFVGRWRIKLQSEVTAAAYNPLRIARMLARGLTEMRLKGLYAPRTEPPRNKRTTSTTAPTAKN